MVDLLSDGTLKNDKEARPTDQSQFPTFSQCLKDRFPVEREVYSIFDWTEVVNTSPCLT